MDKSKSIWVLVTDAFIYPLNIFTKLSRISKRRNKLFERAWPLRPVAPLSAQLKVKPTL